MDNILFHIDKTAIMGGFKFVDPIDMKKHAYILFNHFFDQSLFARKNYVKYLEIRATFVEIYDKLLTVTGKNRIAAASPWMNVSRLKWAALN